MDRRRLDGMHSHELFRVVGVFVCYLSCQLILDDCSLMALCHLLIVPTLKLVFVMNILNDWQYKVYTLKAVLKTSC